MRVSTRCSSLVVAVLWAAGCVVDGGAGLENTGNENPG